MKKTVTLVTALLAAVLFTGQAWAGFEELEIGITSQAMGGTGVVLPGLDAVLFNPASVGGSTVASVIVSGRMPFTNLDFGTYGFDCAFPINSAWTTAVSLRYFGGELYSEQTGSVTIAGKLSKDMSFGIQPVFCRAAFADGVSSYGSGTAIAVNMGFQVSMYDRWMIAASLRNPFEARLGESSEHLQRRIDGGVRYEPASGMISALTLSRDFNGLRIHVGQALPLGDITLMAGVQSNPMTVSGGLSASVSGIVFQYAVQTHSQLPLSHQAGVIYAF